MKKIVAKDHLDSNGLIVESGRLLAQETIRELASCEPVRIDLHGMPGIASSYFNVFLSQLQDELGPPSLDLVSFDFVSPLQRQVFDRSRSAVLNEASGKIR